MAEHSTDRIVILGAGRFGGSIAESLAKTKAILTIVDVDPDNVSALRDRNIDARFLTGDATSPALLRKAGCEDADAILALTNHDITNLAACHICSTLFESSRAVRIAKLGSQELVADRELLAKFGVTLGYNPEEMVAEEFVKILQFTGTRAVHSYWNNSVNVFVIGVGEDDGLAGRTLAELRGAGDPKAFRVAAAIRDREHLPVADELALREQDELVVVSQRDEGISAVNRLRGDQRSDSRKVFIAGGTTVGRAIAQRIESRYSVTMIEPSQTACAEMIQHLNQTVVDHGNPTDANILRNENIEDAYYFCAVTGRDEENILSALLAKDMGCRKAAVLVQQNSYNDVLFHHRIDTVLSPANITIGTMLKEMSERSRESIQHVGDHGAQLVEFSVNDQAPIVGSAFAGIDWPANVVPCVLSSRSKRDGGGRASQLFADSQQVVKAGDRIIVYVTDGDSRSVNRLLDVPFYV
ncbi:MAG: NAD-binding protein [Betaproteobacteria bacterium AqS2]|uniref:Trk system potassium uptake protein TrkA n=1 Tax=Candidatus Amphirhobacter heronislandensis TaxID=1732024 RepID=A0A930XXZ6_9GAMM|nr:NAD-binding protein [Betaproteobacteria bacterium AqS2]